MKEVKVEWSVNNTVKSIVLFVVHFIVLLLISLFLLLKDKINILTEEMEANGADYLYMGCCLLMLTVLMYTYFFFESKECLASAKTISLVFTVLDLYVIIAFLVGQQGSVEGGSNLSYAIFSRPVALVALLTLVLIGRKEAIFLNIFSSVLLFLLDIVHNRMVITQTAYSSLIVAFVAGMLAIFLASKAKTRIRVIGVGVLVVIPILLIIFLLELTTMVEAEIRSETFWPSLMEKLGFGIFGGMTSAILFLFLLPIFERLFNCLTVYRLREITAPDAPLLQRLKQQAPGTFNH